MKLSSLTIFFPSLNDAIVLPSLIMKAHETGKSVTDDLEIIVINDGSTDTTSQTILKLQKTYPELRLVEHENTLGYGAALRSGFTHATKDYVFYTDGDGQYEPAELALLVSKMNGGVTIVNGYKIKRHDGWLRRVSGEFYNASLHRLFRLPISDIDCDFRLIKRRALSKLALVSSSGVICLELILKLYKGGAVFREVAVHHYPRRFGRSQFFRPARLIHTAKELLRVWYYRHTI